MGQNASLMEILHKNFTSTNRVPSVILLLRSEQSNSDSQFELNFRIGVHENVFIFILKKTHIELWDYYWVKQQLYTRKFAVMDYINEKSLHLLHLVQYVILRKQSRRKDLKGIKLGFLLYVSNLITF